MENLFDRTCKYCGLVKDKEEFTFSIYKNGKKKIRPQCLDCKAKSKKARYYENRTAELQKQRLYYQENSVKISARNQARKAEKDGVIKRPQLTCQYKGCEKTTLQRHHHDYGQPLNVIWLCAKHHRRLDDGHIKLADLDLYGDQLIFLLSLPSSCTYSTSKPDISEDVFKEALAMLNKTAGRFIISKIEFGKMPDNFLKAFQKMDDVNVHYLGSPLYINEEVPPDEFWFTDTNGNIEKYKF